MADSRLFVGLPCISGDSFCCRVRLFRGKLAIVLVYTVRAAPTIELSEIVLTFVIVYTIQYIYTHTPFSCSSPQVVFSFLLSQRSREFGPYFFPWPKMMWK